MTSVSCPSSTLCATVSRNASQVFFFNGSSWSAGSDFNLVGPSSISCPAVDFCAAVADSEENPGGMVTFNGTTWSKAVYDSRAYDFTQVSCASTTSCVVIDGLSRRAIFGHR